MNRGRATAPTTLLPFCVANRGSDTVTVYAAGARGNTAPIATIQGSATGLSYISDLASDAFGRIYVVNGPGTITTYASNANGNVPPLATITTDSARYIAVDSLGSIYVTCLQLSNQILVFAAGAQGDAAPVRTIGGSNTQLFQGHGIAVDQAGMIYIVNIGGDQNEYNDVVIYAANANGNASPVAVIAGTKTGLENIQGIAVDGSGRIYVLNYVSNMVPPGSVTVYAKGSNGNVPPIATIQGSETGMVGFGMLAVDSIGTIYVATTLGSNTPGHDNSAVLVYSPGSNGNVAPILTLAGPDTQLNHAWGIALLPGTSNGCLSLLFPNTWRTRKARER